MPKTDPTAQSLLASLEERATKITELERETQAQALEIARLKQRCESQERGTDQMGQWLKAEQDKVKKLSEVIATMDTNAIKALAKQRDAVIERITEERDRLTRQLARAEGWIDAVIGNHPTRGEQVSWRNGALDKALSRPDRVIVGMDQAAPGTEKSILTILKELGEKNL